LPALSSSSTPTTCLGSDSVRAELLQLIGPEWLWHPLGQCVGSHAEYIRCRSYNFWSGSGSDLGELTLLGILGTAALAYKQRNCHVRWCWRMSFHPVRGTTRVVCHKHHTVEVHDAMRKWHDDAHPERLGHGESVDSAGAVVRHDTPVVRSDAQTKEAP